MKKTSLMILLLFSLALALGAIGCGGGEPSEPGPWTKLDPDGDVPSARSGHAMVYDPGSGQVILFGGSDGPAFFPGDTLFGDTWGYDPAANSWTELSPTGDLPPARMWHCIVYASSVGKVILFGGRIRGDNLNDTWAYDPVTNRWADLQPQGTVPRARDMASMAYDPASGKVILFGGYDKHTGSCLDDTWAYDPVGNTWTELSPAGEAPPRRERYSLVYDPTSGLALLFGGTQNNPPAEPLNDTWAYDPAANTWTQLSPEGGPPRARFYHSMVHDPTNGSLLLFGGADSGIFRFEQESGDWSGFPDWAYPEDMWAYDPVANTWSEIGLVGDVPSARCGSAMVFDPVSGKVILFGGVDPRTDKPSNETWSYDPAFVGAPDEE